MSRHDHSEQAEQKVRQNKLFSLWTPEELYDLCLSAARATCTRLGYEGETEDTAHNLWIYLWEQGHVIEYPEHKGAIYRFLKRLGRDKLRPVWKYDRKHISLGLDDFKELEISDCEQAARAILEEVAADELMARVEQQARGDQIEIVKSRLEGATQADIAKHLDINQSQVSRSLNALRKRVGDDYGRAIHRRTGETD